MNPDTTVLIAEDDDGHAALIEKNLRRAGMEKPCHRLRDGQETLDYFLGSGNVQLGKTFDPYRIHGSSPRRLREKSHGLTNEILRRAQDSGRALRRLCHSPCYPESNEGSEPSPTRPWLN
jgi:hypothetical protein